MKKLIKVEQEDINNGVRHSNNSCPIALAINRTLGVSCRVTMEYISIGTLWANLSGKARQFIHGFDRGFPVEPFEFEIEII